jgi:hypothetical protein
LDRGGVAVFGPDGGFNLNGGRPIPSDLIMEWKNILPVDPNFPARRPRKIDTKLSLPLTDLPASVVPPPDPTIHLAVRNTLRGKHVGLPSGQQVARAMRVNVLSNAVLGLSADPGWGGEAPLWFYILKEAELPPYKAEQLGPVGGRIVAEVLVGLLQRTRIRTCIWTRRGSPPHRSHRRPANSPSSTCCDMRARPDRAKGATAAGPGAIRRGALGFG